MNKNEILKSYLTLPKKIHKLIFKKKPDLHAIKNIFNNKTDNFQNLLTVNKAVLNS